MAQSVSYEMDFVLFMDIVGYSKEPIDGQPALMWGNGSASGTRQAVETYIENSNGLSDSCYLLGHCKRRRKAPRR